MSQAASDDQWQQPVLLHVGLHKCASTWLQKTLFSDETAGFHAPLGAMASMTVTEFVTVDPLIFDPERARQNLAEAASPLHRDGMVTVISHEALSSRPHHGRYYAPIVARRLHDVFPNARILLVFREQLSMIYALYVEHVRNGGTHTLKDFLGTGTEPPGWAPTCQLSFFEYDRLLEFYRNEFGANNVLALPLELLRAAPGEFQNRIFDFLYLPRIPIPQSKRENTTWSPMATSACRISNRFVRRNPLGPNQSVPYRLSQKVIRTIDRIIPSTLAESQAENRKRWISSRLNNKFAESNRRLACNLELPLEELGYDVSQ